MFYLAEMRKIVKLEPRYFGMNTREALSNEIDIKLANKVVLNVGLCIALYDITSVETSYIFPGDGSSHTPVTFRYIVFRPFINEVLHGKIKSANADSIQVSLGFFDDIIIPKHALPHPSRFNEVEQIWVWEYGEGENEEKHDLFLDPNETIRFKVTDETFTETSRSSPFASTPGSEVPYLITASINESGLGMLNWWKNN